MTSTTLECIRSLDQKVGKRWRFHKGAINDWPRQHPERMGSSERANQEIEE